MHFSPTCEVECRNIFSLFDRDLNLHTRTHNQKKKYTFTFEIPEETNLVVLTVPTRDNFQPFSLMSCQSFKDGNWSQIGIAEPSVWYDLITGDLFQRGVERLSISILVKSFGLEKGRLL